MVRTIHCRPMVMIILMLGLALITFSKPGHAVPQQRYRPPYQCHTCATSPSSPTSSSTRRPPGLPHNDIEEAPAEVLAPISIDIDESSPLVEEATTEELPPSEPVHPLEVIGAAVVLMFLVFEGLRWERRRTYSPQVWRKSGVRKLPTSVQR